MGRLTVIHILESGQDMELFEGRIDQAKCDALFKHWIQIDNIDTAFICGPEPMMLAIAEALKTNGLTDEQIKFELFSESQQGRLAKQEMAKRSEGQSGTEITVIIDGARRSFTMQKGQSVLEAALENGQEAPFSCKAGVCSTCMGKVLEGEVEMISNHALEDYEVERGYVLTCQSYPLSDTLTIDYDTH
jgi:ring-1,2-phenylacetyl-CoA epoxidase subunit PaaE